MTSERKNNPIYDLCKDHMHAYVLAELVDGERVDGIITGLDGENVYFAVPIDYSDQSDRQFWGGYGYGPGFGYQGYGYGGYGGFGGYGRPRRRFDRLILPLTAIAALSVLPWY